MKDFWLDRWKTKDTPWQQADPESLLLKHLAKKPAQKIFVPLCGRSTDMAWLYRQGHQVMGAELSQLASRSFFEDLKINYTQRALRNFQVFEADRAQIFAGDFFELEFKDLPSLNLIYDRATIIALPEKMRQTYSQKIIELSKKLASDDFEMLVIIRHGMPQDQEGPPFNVTEAELHSLYSAFFKMECLEEEKRPSRNDPNTFYTDAIYRLRI